MRIEIEIPKEFEPDYVEDKFKDFFSRVLSDIKTGDLCGRYEREIVEMFINAFEESKLAYDVEAKVTELEKQAENAKMLWDEDDFYLGKANAYENAIEIIREPSPDLSQEMEEERE